ncbi:hypothetical protein KW795_00610, partial [Candidatus Microgenomates bacterium]|nr:hypothetical protein [Candidatus Microgenomates bacterium]
MRNKGFAPILIIIIVIIGAFVGYFAYTQKERFLSEIKPQPITIGLANNWEKYVNSEYAFEISYPKEFKRVNDTAWNKALLILYSGGQSYDFVIEVWDSRPEYQNKYGSRLDNITVKQVGNKYLTLYNNNNSSKV